MDLSTDVQNLHEPLKFIKSRNESLASELGTSKNSCDFDIIDVSQINFEDDECWLYKAPAQLEDPPENSHSWSNNESNESVDDYFPTPTFSQNIPQKNLQKNIDTRTFTRPKKRFTRPSIEKYNEEVYGNSNDIQNENSFSTGSKRKSTDEEHFNHSTIQEVNETTVTGKPLSFDLSQPTSSYYFEQVLANAADLDSFQNMSPPSLVNSMCSSTFANLMESSFIKNDPVLREIRDTDYTDSVLLQDSEPPMFQSITESCSSLNSDTPESFLKKVSYSGTFRKNMSDFSKSELMNRSNSSSVDLNVTFEKPIEPDIKVQNLEIEVQESPELNNEPNFNGTYRRSPKANHTFRKSDARNATLILKSAFEKSSNENLDQNDTITLSNESDLKELDFKRSLSNTRTIISDDTVDDMKKQLTEAVQITDLNRLSYCLDDDNVHLESSYGENEMNRTMNMKRSSLGCSTGSADSLDRMSSSLSNSSRGSNKMLNMADVDAIVEMQERSLQQVMSTPKPNAGPKKLWENNFISPIVPNDRLSDSDLSSNDEYKSVKSTFSKTSLDNYATKPVKSMGYLGGKVDTKLKTNQRSTYTLAGQKPLQAVPNAVRGSYSNLRTVQSNIPGSQTNLYRPNNLTRGPSSTSNLLSMGQKLKGSYTSLRPISANLPVAPPINSHLNTTLTLPKATNPNVTQNIESRTKVVEVPPMPRGRTIPGDNHFVKPQQPRASGLPRPTGIPRPSSRIPGPRTNVRPSSSRSANGRTSKDGYQ